MPPTRLPVLDALRGVAILVVFVFHFAGEVYGFDHYHWDGPWRQFAPTGTWADYALYPLTLGWSGVSLFFVLSGFVIHLGTAAAPADRPFATGGFFRRRFWRIYPPYLVAVVGLILLQKGRPVATQEGAADVFAHLLLVHNYSSSTFLSLNGAYWSLAVEAQFYLLYPLVVVGRKRLGMGVVLGMVAALSLLVRGYLLATTDCPYPISVTWASVPVLWLDWVLGAYLAERYLAGRPVFGRWPLVWAAGLGAAFVAASLYQPTNGFTFTLASAAWAAVVDAAVRRPRERLSLPVRPLAFVGLVSYSLYLWHTPLMPPVLKRLSAIGLPHPSDSGWAAVMACGLTLLILVGVSFVLYFTVERWSVRVAHARGRRA